MAETQLFAKPESKVPGPTDDGFDETQVKRIFFPFFDFIFHLKF